MGTQHLPPELEALRESPNRVWESLEAYFTTASWKERAELLNLLSRLEPHPHLVNRALEVLAREGDVPLKTAILELLQRWGARTKEPLLKALENPDYRGKRFVIEVLSRFKERAEFSDHFLKVLRDPDPNNRVAVLEAIDYPLSEPDFLRLLERFRDEKEPMVQFAYLSLFQRLLKGEGTLYRNYLVPFIPSTLPSGYLLAPWLGVLTEFPPHEAVLFIKRWQGILTSPHLMEEFIRWLMRMPLSFVEEFLKGFSLEIPSGVFYDLRNRIVDPETYAGLLLVSARTDPETFLELFRSGTLPNLKTFALMVQLLPREVLWRLGDLLRPLPSHAARKLFLHLCAVQGEKGYEDLFIEWGEKYPELRPELFRYGAELGYRWVLHWLSDLFTLPEEEFGWVEEGLRVFTYRNRRILLDLFQPIVEKVELSREWIRVLRLVESLGLFELRPFIERSLRRAEPELRADALRLMSEFYLEEAGSYIRLGLTDESLLVRLRSLEIWETIASEKDEAEIRALFNDPIPWVRARALIVWVRVKGGGEDLYRFLSDPDECLRFFALRLCRGLRLKLPPTQLLNLLRDPHPLVVLEAIRYLKEMRGNVEDLKPLLNDSRWMVRLRVLEAFQEAGARDVLREHLPYEADPEIRAYITHILKSSDSAGFLYTEERLFLRAIFTLIYEISGIQIPPTQYPNFLFKLRKVAETQRIKDFAEFYVYLCFHPLRDEMLLQCIEAVSTGETFFYREVSTLEFFISTLYPRLRKNLPMGLPLRVYSIGCSTGEEPYTLAMLAAERGITPKELAIIGADIHRGALKRAREGFYRPRAMDQLPIFLQQKYFQRSQGGYRLNETIRRYVTFIHWNLLDPSKIPLLPRADALFCRNLLIYFDHQSRLKAVESFERVLKPGGVLFLGHTETLLHIPTRLELVTEEGEFYYRYPDEGKD